MLQPARGVRLKALLRLRADPLVHDGAGPWRGRCGYAESVANAGGGHKPTVAQLPLVQVIISVSRLTHLVPDVLVGGVGFGEGAGVLLPCPWSVGIGLWGPVLTPWLSGDLLRDGGV